MRRGRTRRVSVHVDEYGKKKKEESAKCQYGVRTVIGIHDGMDETIK